MLEKVRKLVGLINSGTKSISIHHKRDYYRHVDAIDSEVRWLNLGERLRGSMDKVVHSYQQV